MEKMIDEPARGLPPVDHDARLDDAGHASKEALAKLAKFSPKIGYPTKWRDYTQAQS